jgi:hypothetical protein
MTFWYEHTAPAPEVERAASRAVADALAEMSHEYVVRPHLIWIKRSRWLEQNPDQLDLTGRKPGYVSLPMLVDGCVFPNEIRNSLEPSLYINADVTPERAHEAVRHELGHFFQIKYGHDRRVSSAELERGADAFAKGVCHPFTDLKADVDRGIAQLEANIAKVRAKVGAAKRPGAQEFVRRVTARSNEYQTLVREYQTLARTKAPLMATKGLTLPRVKSLTSTNGLATRTVDIASLRAAVATMKAWR